ncbi:hypothetical protein ACFW9F_11815 [Streptomyces sp. NPDC059506]|uniref:hypothetical protein n=1 Tax=Streptomyces sp. NPDC059506 TaxID=3347751 RepID=UPI00368FCBDE
MTAASVNVGPFARDLPLDLSTMRQTIGKVLASDAGPLQREQGDDLERLMRGHLAVVIPEALGRRTAVTASTVDRAAAGAVSLLKFPFGLTTMQRKAMGSVLQVLVNVIDPPRGISPSSRPQLTTILYTLLHGNAVLEEVMRGLRNLARDKDIPVYRTVHDSGMITTPRRYRPGWRQIDDLITRRRINHLVVPSLKQIVYLGEEEPGFLRWLGRHGVELHCAGADHSQRAGEAR